MLPLGLSTEDLAVSSGKSLNYLVSPMVVCRQSNVSDLGWQTHPFGFIEIHRLLFRVANVTEIARAVFLLALVRLTRPAQVELTSVSQAQT